jgi:hypothetical protein
VDYDDQLERMTFFTEKEDMPPYAMMQLMEPAVTTPVGTFATGASAEIARSMSAKSSRR